jgi:hypothetical protein
MPALLREVDEEFVRVQRVLAPLLTNGREEA